MKTVAVIVNGDTQSAAGVRARGLFGPLSRSFDARIFYREREKGRSLLDFTRSLVRIRPDVCYVVNPSISGVWAAVLARVGRICPFIVDTGDLAYALARLVGNPGWPGRQAIRLTESAATSLATAVVVRGTYHKELLERSGRRAVYLVRDGTDTSAYERPRDESLRAELGIGDALCVGLIGALRWSRRLRMSYGWDLVEALALVERSVPVMGLVIGDGDALDHLRNRARALGVVERIRFVGSVPPSDVTRYVQQLDIAISTQTNNDVGRVRTTGKLPEYMAAGCYVLASDVGEARLLLPDEMRVQYTGVKDHAYPARLARRLESLVAEGPAARENAVVETRLRAKQLLDYRVLSTDVAEVVRAVGARSLIGP